VRVVVDKGDSQIRLWKNSGCVIVAHQACQSVEMYIKDLFVYVFYSSQFNRSLSSITVQSQLSESVSSHLTCATFTSWSFQCTANELCSVEQRECVACELIWRALGAVRCLRSLTGHLSLCLSFMLDGRRGVAWRRF